ncbi:ESX secretion-associated protein EspG [Nocardia terpenica]|uniref:ESX secretion-associated protein EspG n=1 Tax=Nocardia terpenica TaxID=455432 RepID=UPI001893896D|nr:ESX secretion-associated protein EspG [Nocardia terpenica]MBF6062819.1 ESX secretion-associated protein EspG [Nocardia terpenica]MBF6105046.1 ESX secretion-associated protein EspG [Nocardia terpenica]MBF6112517.1 ESX secretion-associated protein EspG [Nocardia terpenica]MBF6118774.1 ESX secretion-associated protein EspG [Nocardia terpenica]MBF6154243.1 ESX secretion-associated protein EspG [Nocardia terpenica]
MTFEFTADKFFYAWRQLGVDRWPVPLAIRPSAAWRDDWETIESELRQRLRVLEDPDLLPVLRTAADPDMSLVMIGARKKPLRVYGAVTANVGVTLVQRPDPGPDRIGNVVIEVGPPALVPKVFAAVAGDQPAGRHTAMVETWERLQDNTPAVGSVRDDSSTADRMRRLLAAPRTGHGHIEVRADRHAERPSSPRYVSWFDVEGDGRYTYTRSYGDFHIDPCSTGRLQQRIGRLMGATG